MLTAVLFIKSGIATNSDVAELELKRSLFGTFSISTACAGVSC